MRYKIFITVIWLGLPFISVGQWYLGSGYQHGYNLPLYDDSPETNRSSPFAHLSIRYESEGRFDLLEQLYNNPTISFQLAYQNLGNDAVMGNAITFLPDFKFPWKKGKRTSLFWSGGVGVGWVDKPFDKASNPTNEAIGTHLNIYAQAHINFEYRINNSWLFSAEAGFHHMSNSFFAFPNLGVNIPSGGVSLYRRITPPRSDYQRNILTSEQIEANTPWKPFVRMIYGVTERAYDGPYFAVYGIGLGVSRKIKIHRLVSLGAEYMFDESRYAFLTHVNGKESNEEFQKSSRYLVFAGHEYLMKHFSLVTEVGIYLTRQFDRQSIISTKAGFNFYPLNNLTRWKNQFSVGAYIRGYFLRADFFEISVNYRV